MNKKPNEEFSFAKLRHRAEARLRKRRENQRPATRVSKSKADAHRLHHELQVHQVELEMQNSELQGARDRLEIQLEKYTDLYDFAPVGYFSLDEQGSIMEVNLTGAAMLGLERSRLVNRRLPRFVAPASQPMFMTFLKKVFTGSKAQICEALFQKEGGGTFWASVRATPAVCLKGVPKWCRASFVDITRHKLVNDKLRESDERYRTLFDLGPVGVYSCEASGVIREFNRAAVEVWGCKPALGDTEKRFCGSFKLFRPDGRFVPHAQCPMAEVLSGKIAEVRDMEVLIERPDGSRVTVVVNIRPLKNERGEVTGAINCFYDITARKRAEATQLRIKVLGASNRKLEMEIVRRQRVVKALNKSERSSRQLLDQSRLMQERLRLLSRQVLSAQEDERKRISRELHDVIAQTLTGINVRLSALKKEATIDTKNLERNIARTQELVEHSVDIVHQFARELRPTVLDDLGLIPALHTFMKSFKEQTGIGVSLSAFASIEQVDGDKRTVLYRVAQEALTNVARHAHASQAEVSIQKLDGVVCMKIKDNGNGFQEESVLRARKNQRLGLLSMRERLEMVGGNFTVKSAPGKGTTVQAQIPFAKNARGGGKPADGTR